jgi:hypothetical protein
MHVNPFGSTDGIPSKENNQFNFCNQTLVPNKDHWHPPGRQYSAGTGIRAPGDVR